MKQRGVIVLAIFGAGFIMLAAQQSGAPADSLGPYSLISAATPLTAISQLFILTIAAVCIGAIAGAWGNPLVGVFVVAMALLFPTLKAGGIDLWLRSANSQAAYWPLIAELAIWALWVLAMSFTCQRLAQWFQKWAPEWCYRHEDEDELAELGEGSEAIANGKTPGSDGASVIWGGLLAAAVTVALTPVFVQSSTPQQVVWGIGVASMFGALLGHQAFQSNRTWGVLLAPLLAGAFWYAVVALKGGSGSGTAHDMLQIYFSGEFVSGALALPAMYASAGVAGATVGLGWSQVLVRSKIYTDLIIAREAIINQDPNAPQTTPPQPPPHQ